MASSETKPESRGDGRTIVELNVDRSQLQKKIEVDVIEAPTSKGRPVTKKIVLVRKASGSSPPPSSSAVLGRRTQSLGRPSATEMMEICSC